MDKVDTIKEEDSKLISRTEFTEHTQLQKIWPFACSTRTVVTL